MDLPRILVTVAVTGLLIGTGGCALLGPSCLERQKRGDVTSLGGAVEAMQVSTNLVPYDQRGSQNDVQISWAGQGTAGGPRLYLYATAASCTNFTPPSLDGRHDNDAGSCQIISTCGGSLSPDARPCAHAGSCQPTREEIVCRSLIVTGPGNGAPPGFSEYRLHVVGDPTQAASYSISITYFFGPDC